MKGLSLRGNKFVYIAIVGVIVVAGFVVAALINKSNVKSSAQYSVYQLNQAVEQGNENEFNKYYAVKNPPQAKSNPGGEKSSTLEQYKQEFYVPLSLQDAQNAKAVDESGSGKAKIIYLPDGDKQVAMRVEKQGDTWKVVDIAKIDNPRPQ